MEHVHASLSASISEFKKNPTALLIKADGKPIVILNHNKPTAYLVPVDTYDLMLKTIENIELLEIAKERSKEKGRAIKVDLDDL